MSIVLPDTTRSSSHLTLSSDVNDTLPVACMVATRDLSSCPKPKADRELYKQPRAF